MNTDNGVFTAPVTGTYKVSTEGIKLMNELKEFREKYGMTQTELGELLFYSMSQIQRLENPDKKWGSKMTPHIAKIFSEIKEKWSNVRPVKKP